MNEPMSDDRLSKLPVWAQNLIKERDLGIAHLEEQLTALRETVYATHENSNVRITDLDSGDDVNLPPDSAIAFDIGRNGEVVATVVGTALQLQITAGDMAIYPGVRDTILIRSVDPDGRVDA